MSNDTDATESQAPQSNELWTLYNPSEQNRSRLAIARYLGPVDESRTESSGQRHRVRILYDSYDDLDTVNPPYTMSAVPETEFHAKIPDDQSFDDDFAEALDYVLGLVTVDDAVELLHSEPSYMTGNRRGYEALRFFILDGMQESITEFSVGHGHGPSRYASAVEQRIQELPEHLLGTGLESELERWTGSFGMQPETAAKIVEVRLLMEQYLDEDHEDDIRYLVNEYDLEYDEYRNTEAAQ